MPIVDRDDRYPRTVRNAIRIWIPLAALAALGVGIGLPSPHHLPALALGNRELLWLERTLVLFYGFLLLVVPVLRALEGELPIELSARGARYAEASDAALELLRDRIDEVEEFVDESVELMDRVARRLPDEDV